VAVSDEYLSVGPFVESLDEVGVHTQHKMHYAPHYASDILSFERAPEKTIDFYTLNSSDIREAIKEFKSSSTVYSLLGDFSRLLIITLKGPLRHHHKGTTLSSL
jgi:hypothetical protein